MVYRFSPSSNELVSVALTPQEATEDLTVTLLEDLGQGCDVNACLGYGATAETSESLVFEAEAGRTYYLSVDGATASDSGWFDLELSCGAVTSEVCGNGIDDDSDGQIDCVDGQCATSPFCNLTEVCGNGVDDDSNGFSDCSEAVCATDAACIAEVCNNTTDDDGDGLQDCADPECGGDISCPTTELCEDLTDNDSDGLVDCADPDCGTDVACVPELCSNGVDDDQDGQTDCADSACAPLVACGGNGIELCGNGLDDDSDGYVDCSDGACGTDPACAAEDCTDGIDNDGDGLVDCNDYSCMVDLVCVGGSCSADTSVTCNTSWTGTTAGVSTTDYYGCGVAALGPENVYEINPGSTTLSLTLTHGSEVELDLVVTSDGSLNCNLSDCAGYNNTFGSPETLAIDAQTGLNYNIFVEGSTLLDAGSYTLDVDCGTPTVESCSNGADDDGDSLFDCLDPDCQTAPNCMAGEVCTDGVDNDFDGGIDCGDPDCAGEIQCMVELCSNSADDDQDNLVDCDDPDCATNLVCD